MSSDKYDKKFQKEYEKFKDHYKTEEYELENLCEVYLPFWICKQDIIIQADEGNDIFSKILLELVDMGVKQHTDICTFMGVKDDDFTLMQLHFLIKNKLLEVKDNLYEITFNGRKFLNNELKEIEQLEECSIKYIIDELEIQPLNDGKFRSFYNSSLSTSFDKNQKSIVYRDIQTYKLKNIFNIGHKDKPTINKMIKSNFVDFVDETIKGSFYDYENSKIEAHKRSIAFLMLVFKNKDKEFKIDIRHCKKSVKDFTGNILEEKLSKEVEIYFTNNPTKLERIHNEFDK